ncbi:abc-type tungstate transport system, atp-binding protein [hydrocarbon metagenome]|uniref:Abc-type tungstate transport system, atp-binding protein n=1 Tax=hydrocarbon metagenome TaxID=938273 RepID=A0A0W8F065_9ZZZZ
MIGFDRVFMNFGEKEVLKDVSFTIDRGEIFTFIGPSGSGKTTILRLIDMLERPTSGGILIEGTDVSSMKDRDRITVRRTMSMVFQKPSPLRGSVFENVAVGLRFRDIGNEEIQARVPEALELVGLGDYQEQKAITLSGGEMQRVAIARAIATKPDILLLDEPTANLDPVSTEKIESLIGALKDRFGITVVLSTHDMVQGQRLADRMAVVIDGRIGQIGTSKEIFYQPMNRAVAHMVGVENILEGTIARNDQGLASIDINGTSVTATTPFPPGTSVTMYMRPEDITFHVKDGVRSSARNEFSGTIRKVLPIGPMVRMKVDAGIPLIAVITQRSYEELGLGLGVTTDLAFKASAIHVVERKA